MPGLEILGPHAGFIVAAYLVTAAVVLSLIVWVAADQRIQARVLAELEAGGTPRRPPSPARPPESGERAKKPAGEPA